MKSFVKLIYVFLFMVLTFCVEPHLMSQQENVTTNYIQNISYENVELISNNIVETEIYSGQEGDNTPYFGNSPQLVSFVHDDDCYLKNKAQLNGRFIHNLSTNLKEVQQIRAP